MIQSLQLLPLLDNPPESNRLRNFVGRLFLFDATSVFSVNLMARVEEVFNALSTSNRKDRKIRLSQAINVLKDPVIRRYLDSRSEQKWLHAEAAIFTWRSVYEVTVYILREELARTKGRSSKDVAAPNISGSSELADCCRLLTLFASFGLRSNPPLQAEGLVSQITDLLSDARFFSMKPSLVSCLSVAVMSTSGLDIFDAATCLLFLHSASLSTLALPRCCSDLFDQQALGWLLRLLRWSLATAFTSQSSQNALINIFFNHYSSLLKLWPKFRDVTSQRSAYVSSADPSLFSSDDFVICVNEFLGDAFALDELFASSPVAKRIFPQKSNFRPTLNAHALTDLFMSNKPLLLYDASFRQDSPDTLADPCFIHSDACFLVDEPPTLLPLPTSTPTKKDRLHVNAIETSRELLCLCRWILNICLLRFSRSGVSPSNENDDVTMKQSCTFVSTVVQFYALECRRFAERVSFLAEESVQAQVLSMWDFFGTCAAALCVARSPSVVKLTGTRDLLEPLKGGSEPSLTTSRSQVDHKSLLFTHDSSPYIVAASMIPRDEKTGWLWWPVFDWICRLNWQCACACGSAAPLDLSVMLHSAAVVVKSVRHPLAIDCAISALISAVSAATACVQRFGSSTFSGDSASNVEALWTKAIEWLEQLARGHPMPAASDFSSSVGTARRALLQDRLLCHLLSCLVELDSVLADTARATATLLPHVSAPNWDTYACCPPLAFLLDSLTHCTAVASATYLLVQAALCWSLPVLFPDHFMHLSNHAFPVTYPKKKTPYPLFGQRHMHSITQSIRGRLHSAQPIGQGQQVLLARTLKLHLEALLGYLSDDNDKEVGALLASLVEDGTCETTTTGGDRTQIFVDLFDCEDLENCLSGSQGRAAPTIQLDELEDDTSADAVDPTDCEPCVFTHLLFSPCEELLNACGAVLKVLVETRVPWRRQEDVVWLLSLLCAFCNATELAAASSAAPLQPCHGPPLLGLFCVLLDSLREALKSQLLLKRW
ncbi:unnamed protein product, partial [Dibothriocephalus latus]